MIPWFGVPEFELGPFRGDLPELFALAGAFSILCLVRARARNAGLSVRRAVDGVFLALVLALLLGHTLDVLLYRSSELMRDWSLLMPWRGGYCSLGAFAGVSLAAWLAFRGPSGVDWRYLDQVALAVVLGLAILRVGCFLGHHHAGRFSSFVLAVAYPGGARHDLGLYEALFAFGLLLLLWLLDRHRRESVPGFVSAQAALLYGSGRFALEFLRGDDLERIAGHRSDPRYLGLTVAQYAALGLIGLAAIPLCSAIRHSRGRASNAPGLGRDVQPGQGPPHCQGGE